LVVVVPVTVVCALIVFPAKDLGKSKYTLSSGANSLRWGPDNTGAKTGKLVGLTEPEAETVI